MRRINIKYLFVLTLLIITSNSLFAQVKFFSNFDSGSFKNAGINFTLTGYEPSDSLMENPKIDYFGAVITKSDPDNPARPDLKPSSRWFYFLMTGIKNSTVTLDITTNDSKRPLYSYDNINFSRFSKEEAPAENGKIVKKFDKDSVYIAYFVPYNVERNSKKIAQWSSLPHVKEFSIGKSEKGRDMQMMVISNNIHDGLIPDISGKLNYSEADKNKRVVYIHGRVHPSETPSSWHLESIIDILTQDTPYANDLRSNTIFYILPFANPDGVYEGYSRSNSNGVNIEVNWDDKEEVTSQEVKNIRGFLTKLKKSKITPDMFLNMHSQISPNITYWVHDAKSTSNDYYKDLMLLCNLTMYQNPYFDKDELSFSKVASRYLEGWMRKEFNKKTIAITFETPYSHYHKDSLSTWVTPENLMEQGINSVNAVSDLLALSSSERVVIDEPKRARGFKSKRDHNHFYFGKRYLVSKEAGAVVNYDNKTLPKGEYQVYMWSVGRNVKASEAGENEWVRVGNYTQLSNGNCQYQYQTKSAGERIDRVLFIKEK